MRLSAIDRAMTNTESVVSALKLTKKGQLTYDDKWREEGRTEEIVNNVEENLVSINLRPRSLSTNPTTSLTNGTSQNHHQQHRPHSPEFLNSTCRSIGSGDNLPLVESPVSTLSPSIDENELIKCYEQERSDKVQQRVEETASRLRAKYDSLLETIDSEIRLIQNNFIVLSIQAQKQYDEEYNKLVKDLDQDKLTTNCLPATNTARKDVNLKLKEFQEKQKLLEKQKELKQQQQIEYRQAVTKCKEAINRTVCECEAQLEQQKSSQLQMTTSVIDELQHFRTLLLGLVSDLEVLLLTSREFTAENVQFAFQRQQESERIKQRFFDLLTQQIAKCQPPLPAPAVQHQPSAAVSPDTTSIISPPTQQQSQSSNVQNISKPAVPSATTTAPADQKPATRSSMANDEFTCSPKKTYIRTQLELVDFEEICNKFSEDKNKRTLVQLSIRSRLNTMCNEHISKLSEKTKKLLELLQGHRVEAPKGYVQCSNQDGSLQFAINCAAKSFLNVAIKQKNMAVKLAPVIVILWSRVPQFGKIFLAQLYRLCPYAIPYYPTQEKGQSEEEYMVACGYQLNSQGVISETDEMFQERMYPLIQLYSAVIQCNLASGHPRDLHYAWNWLARVINDTPKPIMTALMLDAFLSVSAHKLLQFYGRQFQKIVHFISRQYLQKIELVTDLADRQTFMKFKSLLSDIERKMRSGRLPDVVRQLAADLDLVPDNFFR